MTDASELLRLAGAPEIPQAVSRDGREVWDWAARFSDYVHRQAKMRELAAEVSAPKRCGDCQSWMKSRECPKEHNVGGMSRGPSMNGAACVRFAETLRSVTNRAAKAAELASLRAIALTQGQNT